MAAPYHHEHQYNQDRLYGNQPPNPPQPAPRKPPPLPRSISSTNLERTTRCRSVVQNDWVRDAPRGGTNFFSTVPAFTLTLPSLDKYPGDFQQCVFSQLIDRSTQQFLEGEKCLNWCAATTRFLPLYTMGDGNCLLHAASLSMWGIHDRDYTLRRAVFTALQNHTTSQLYRRWKYTREQENSQMGIQLEDFQWEREWQVIVNQASTDVPQGKPLESLEDFHIFVLANVLRRPIVMYAAPKLRSQATGGTLQQINFHGIYLPLLWDPHSCKKDPLPLAYYGGHFVALVAVEYTQQYNHGGFTLPLVDFHGQTLPVRFTLTMEEPTAMMMDYLRVVSVSGHNSPYITSTTVVCAKLSIPNRPAYLEPLLSGFIEACHSAYYGNQPGQPPTVLDQVPPNTQPMYDNASAPPTPQGREKCINHCGMYGDPDKGGLCFQCHQKHLLNEQGAHQTQPNDQYSQFQRNFPAPGEHQPETTPPVGQPAQKCINDCGNYADPNSVGLCGRCLQKATEAASASEGKQQNTAPQSGSFNSIKCPKCPNPGQPSFLGMCERCYHDNNSSGRHPPPLKGGDHIYETIPGPGNEGTPPPVQDPNVRTKCRTPNCEFFGTAHTANYCSQCFEKDMERILREADTPSGFQQQQAPPPQAQQRAPPPQARQQAPPPQLQQYEQPPQQRSVGEANKCYECREFFANPEYQGLCSGCFLNKTKTQTKEAPPKQDNFQPYNHAPRYDPCMTRSCSNLADVGGYCSACLSSREEPRQRVSTAPQGYTPRYEKCMNMDCNGPRTQNGYCDNCNMQRGRTYAATQHLGLTHQQPNGPARSERPVPKPRQKVGNATTPIAQLSAGLGHMTIEGECFMCSPQRGGISRTNVLCQHHAEMMQKMMPEEMRTAGSHEDVKSKPQGLSQEGTPQGYGVPHPQHADPQYSRTQPHPQQADPRTQPHTQQADPQYSRTQPHPQNHEFMGYRQQPSTRGWSQPVTQFGADMSGQRQFEPTPQHQYEPTLQHQFEPTPQRQFEPTLQRQFEPTPQRQFEPTPQRQFEPTPLSSQQQGHTSASSSAPRQGSSEKQFGVDLEHSRQMNGGGASGATGGGVSGVAGGGDYPVMIQKLLCATAGCSFKGYRLLNDLCPDCYESKYNRKAPEEFPLV